MADATDDNVYRHAIPMSRLGASHDTLASFTDAVSALQKESAKHDTPTEFSLVVVLSPDAHAHDGNNDEKGRGASAISILLGKKLRGFGEGFYNCFGGKLEKGEFDHPSKGAVRELEEETGIEVPLAVMEDGFVGTINFAFEDSDVNRAMRVHLFCIFVSVSHHDESSHDGGRFTGSKSKQQFAHTIVQVDPKQIRGCDEIEPSWFHNIHDIPLDKMFADDSLWLTMLLSHYNQISRSGPTSKLLFDAFYHFHAGGTNTNSIMHRFIQINGGGNESKAPKITLEKRLFHALHVNHIHSPSIKEFKENWAMANAVRTFMKEEERMEYILDVAGGHGALGALSFFLFQAVILLL